MVDENIEEKCYVLMPYGTKGEYSGGVNEATFIYNHIIAPAVYEFAKKANRNIKPDLSIQSRYTGQISRKILEGLAKAEICIVDITGSNPNVFFELGIRYSLRNKTTILLIQDPDKNKIPFDIQGYRCLQYDPFLLEQSKNDLCDFLLSSGDDYPKTDSLVFDTFKHMELFIPNTLSSSGEACDHVLWWDWWHHIKEQVKMLEKFYPHSDPANPDIHVVLGISNGGLIFADLLGRLLFKDIPILSLWADRRAKVNFKNEAEASYYYFQNEFNKATINSIKEVCFKNKSHNNKIGILLVDDLVYTTNTCLQAKAFLTEELKDYEGKYQIMFVPLYCRASTDMRTDQIKEMLICNYTGEDVNEYLEKLKSNKLKFPYEKDLN